MKHPSHVTRSSDASTFDVICTLCGATDQVPGGWGDLALPCSGTEVAPREGTAARCICKCGCYALVKPTPLWLRHLGCDLCPACRRADAAGRDPHGYDISFMSRSYGRR